MIEVTQEQGTFKTIGQKITNIVLSLPPEPSAIQWLIGGRREAPGTLRAACFRSAPPWRGGSTGWFSISNSNYFNGLCRKWSFMSNVWPICEIGPYRRARNDGASSLGRTLDRSRRRVLELRPRPHRINYSPWIARMDRWAPRPGRILRRHSGKGRAVPEHACRSK